MNITPKLNKHELLDLFTIPRAPAMIPHVGSRRPEGKEEMREYEGIVRAFMASEDKEMPVDQRPYHHLSVRAVCAGIRWEIKRQGLENEIRVRRAGGSVFLVCVDDETKDKRGRYRAVMDDFLSSGAPVWEVECDPYNPHATASGYRMVKRTHDGYEAVNVRVKDGRLYLERIEW